jgi:hypothetical protein
MQLVEREHRRKLAMVAEENSKEIEVLKMTQAKQIAEPRLR